MKQFGDILIKTGQIIREESHTGSDAHGPLSWAFRYRRVLVAGDVLAALCAGLGVVALRYSGEPAFLAGVDYRLLALVLVPAWVALLAVTGAYDRAVIGVGTEEFRRVLGGGVRMLAVIAVLAVALKVDVARSVVALAVPSAVMLTLLGRWSARQVLHAGRRRGRWCHRVVLVGDDAECAALMSQLRRHAEAGLRVVAACGPGSGAGLGVPLLSGADNVALAADHVGADTVAVASPQTLGAEGMRRLAWSLEGRGLQLLVAPGLTYVAAPRVVVRPVDGNPLLHVQEPVLSGPTKAVKGVFDRIVALVLALLVLPMVAVLAVLVRLSSPGPAFFRQERVGLDGRVFRVWKLRSMVHEADQLRPGLRHNDVDGLLFKLRRDPRVTPVGRFLRRWSLDELPQLLNVLDGSMSLVGPRPPLPGEVAHYDDDLHRRLLVKPGVTGLWQVSGRSDLPWEEAVRLDLQYVENWSLSLDIAILLRTVAAVLRRRGAY